MYGVFHTASNFKRISKNVKPPKMDNTINSWFLPELCVKVLHFHCPAFPDAEKIKNIGPEMFYFQLLALLSKLCMKGMVSITK